MSLIKISTVQNNLWSHRFLQYCDWLRVETTTGLRFRRDLIKETSDRNTKENVLPLQTEIDTTHHLL